MTQEIALTLTILLFAIILFVTEKLRVDLIALLVLVALALTGLVTPTEALSGFSSPAVVTVWAVFILSGGLSRTGVANIIGRQILNIAGQGEVRLLITIMLIAGVLSAFMNNVGVAALLLPVVINISRQTRIPPSKLLMPLAFGCLLGGLTTLIGTPPNILASDALRDFGLTPFQFFDFAPVGVVIMLVGTAFMILVGRRLLPVNRPMQDLFDRDQDTKELYDLDERLALIILPADSPLAGKTVTESRIGRALGMTILGLQRQGRKQMSIEPTAVLQGGDQLLAVGRLDRLQELSQKPGLVIEEDQVAVAQLLSGEIGLAEIAVTADSPLTGRTLAQVNLRRRYGFNVLTARQNGRPYRADLGDLRLKTGDRLLIQGERSTLTEAKGLSIQSLTCEEALEKYHLQEQLLIVRVPKDSWVEGKTLVESQLGAIFDLMVLGIIRAEETKLMPGPDSQLRGDDTLLVAGDPNDLAVVRGLQTLIVKQDLNMEAVALESSSVGLMEAVLSPHTTVANKTLREIDFREKYGLNVLAIWRNGRAYRSDLGNMPLQFGDAFLLYGPREKMSLLGREPDFILLEEEAQEAPRRNKALLATLIMLAVVGSVLLELVPLSIAAIAGAVLMVLTGCLKMNEAYRQIDWRAVFLIAGMLPLGIAMERSGTASYLADGVMNIFAGLGPIVLMAALFLLTSLASQFMPNAVIMVLMAPIALNAAVNLEVSPYALIMVIAIAASASFMSPVSHPANVLVMGPGGYRFTDFIKVGLPLTLVVLLVTLIVLPIFWPL